MTSPAPASRTRYFVLGLLCLLAMMTYMDRAANANAKTDIMAAVNAGLPVEDQYPVADFFYVLLAFQLAYALFEVPSGWLGDVTGPRATLLRVVFWWSLFMLLIGFTGWTLPGGLYIGFGALIVMQFLFGMGEAGAFPNIAKSLYNWFPAADRGFAKSAIWMCARLMGGLTPALWIILVEIGGITWRQAMWQFAATAAVWCAIFFMFFRNKPREHSWVNAAELAKIDEGRKVNTTPVRVPWGRLLRSRNLWALCLMYTVTNFCWYFLMYNHPTAIKKAYPGYNATDGGKITLALLSGAPLLIGMIGCLLGGILSDFYIRRTGSRKWGRRVFGMLGYGMAGVCYFLAIAGKVEFPGNLWAYAIPLVLMGFFNDLIMAPAWAAAQDIGGRYAATVSGAMNSVGNLVGAVGGIFITGKIIKAHTLEGASDMATSGYVVLFAIYGIVYLLGAVSWLFIDASKPIVPEEE
jgi:MFS family permease